MRGFLSLAEAEQTPESSRAGGRGCCQVVGGIPTFLFLPAACQTLVLSTKADVFGRI